MNTTVRNDQGIALVVVIMMMAILLTISSAALLFSGLNLKTASNLKTGGAALHVADAGIQHALAIIPAGTNFTYGAGPAPVVFTTVFPTATSGYSYVVTATNNPSTSATTSTAILTSEANGPNNSKKKIKAYIGRSSVWTPPGAIYIPGQAQYIETRFNGNSFQISGRDSNPGQAEGSGSANPVPGIATSTSGVTDEISGGSGSLASTQYGQVIGQGSSPSVVTSSTAIDVNQLAIDLINAGVEGVDRQTLSSGSYTSGQWGTSLLPKITHITGEATTTIGGTLAGWGVLIVDGNLTVRGTCTFNGLVIVRGDADINGAGGEGATIWGALLIKESTSTDVGDELTVGGNAKVYYSSQTINTALSHWGNAFPKPAKLIAWHEVMQ